MAGGTPFGDPVVRCHVPTGPSRRRLLAGCLAAVGLAGCLGSTATTPVGYYLRNYTDSARIATVVVDTPVGNAERTHRLDPADDGVPDVVEAQDVAPAVRGLEYTVTLRLDGERVGHHVANADCPAGEESSNEQLDIAIGWGKRGAHRSHPPVEIDDPRC